MITTAKATAMLGFAGVILGSFLPWTRVGAFTTSGLDGDGVFSLMLAALGWILLMANRNSLSKFVAIILIVMGVIEAFHIYEEITVGALVIRREPGAGLFLVIVGAVFAWAGTTFNRQPQEP